MKQVICMFNNFKHYNHMFDQVNFEADRPYPSIHVAQSISYGHWYIWSSYPSSKTAKIDYSAMFSFDPPSAILFFFCLVGVVALMKLFTYFGSKLGLDTVSEEPVSIPTRYFGQQSPCQTQCYVYLESKFLMLETLEAFFLLELLFIFYFYFIVYLAYL